MKPVILLLDDEEDLVSVLADALALRLPDYEVVGSTSVEHAHELLADIEATGSELSLVVVDHMLGGTTGLEFLEELQTRSPGVPSMFYTGRAPAEVAERAREVGARVLWKPVKLSQWLGEIGQMLGCA